MSGLAKVRESMELTLAQAAKKLGLTVALLRLLEDGWPPSGDELASLRKVYGARLTQAEQGELFS